MSARLGQVRLCNVSAMSLHWRANDRWSPGAIRQTNEGIIRMCHWQVMNAALSKNHIWNTMQARKEAWDAI